MILLPGTSGHDLLDVRTASSAYEIRGLAGSDVIFGSAFGDLIVGGPGADQMFGNGGNDTFLLGGVDPNNYDIIHGGSGSDTVLGSAGNDVLAFGTSYISSIEWIDGGGGSDVIRGPFGVQYWDFSQTTLIGNIEIDAGGDNDQITGSTGNDRIIGGAGNDVLNGGLGTDTAVYTGNFAAYTITNLGSGQLRVATTVAADGTDTIRNFEILEFANGTFSNGVFTPFGDPTNTAPVAGNNLYVATEDNALVVNAASGVLGNDEDPDGDALTVSSFDAASAQGGSVAMNPNGSFTYTPASNFNGSDSFFYTIADGRGGFDTAQVTLNVSPVNDAPIANNNSYTGTKDTALVVNVASGVLANDQDADGNTLTIASFDAASAQGGTVAMNSNGSFTYTPPAGFTGTDSFSYTATDSFAQDAATVTLAVSAAQPPTSSFDTIIANLPENEWVKLNVNTFQSVWTPFNQQPHLATFAPPKSIIEAWGAATWDSNRGEYIIWGGGHANYEGNEVYTWSAATLQWERASLPSAIVQIAGAHYETVDGYENSPISSHAYDNLEFLEVADRMINFGGASAHAGAGFVETNGTTQTGPYLWDPSKADPNKVGGLTGSQVNPSQFPGVVGGEMWENRDTWSAATPRPGTMVNGTTDYALIDGVDVVFVNDSSQRLFKYTIPDVNDPSQDTWELVGTLWDSYSGTGAGAYDPDHNIYVRTSLTEFTFWDLDNAGPTNRNISFIPSDPSGEFNLSNKWGMEYDPVREQFILWQGDASIWYLKPPETMGAAGWTLEEAPAPTRAAPVAPGLFHGVLGKWDYVESHDVFIGVTDPFSGDIWAYKPGDWML